MAVVVAVIRTLLLLLLVMNRQLELVFYLGPCH
jgi:hypothetical protein